MNKTVCIGCGAEGTENEAFCASCGSKMELVTDVKHCSGCGQELEEGTKFCAICGSPVAAPVSSVPVQSGQTVEFAPEPPVPEPPVPEPPVMAPGITAPGVTAASVTAPIATIPSATVPSTTVPSVAAPPSSEYTPGPSSKLPISVIIAMIGGVISLVVLGTGVATLYLGWDWLL